jgi:hypothetical protein
MQPTLQSTETPPWVENCRTKPYNHQILGVQKITQNPFFMLGDEMGAGKSLQAIVAAMVLFEQNQIDRVLVVTPAPVRAVWYDPEFGELAKHLWEHIPSVITEYHARDRMWTYGKDGPRVLAWVITNYDFLVNKNRYEFAAEFCNKRTFLICDESSKIKNHKAIRTKAILKLRRRCSRVLLLNGTPIANNPRDMYAQGNIMDLSILETPYVYQFDARYAIKGGWENRETVGWRNLEDMQQRFAPYVLRRLKSDCIDLPEKLPPVVIQPPLTPETWKHYKAMRDDLIVWLDQPHSVSMAAQVIVKILRLAQITSGFIGGVEVQEPDPTALENKPDWIPFDGPLPTQPTDRSPTREIGKEKLEIYLDWLDDHLEEDPNFKLLTWCWFRPELFRLAKSVREKFPRVVVRDLHGNQRKTEREDALRLLDPRTAPEGPAILVGTPDSGAMGYTFTAAHTVMYVSASHSLLNYLQSQDRVHRPGQTHAVSYYHILATGPKGERTIDHTIHKARQGKLDLATWTTAAWRTALLVE